MKITLPFLLLLLMSIFTLSAQEQYTHVPLTYDHWEIPEKSIVSFDTTAGRPSVTLRGNIAAITPSFFNGTLEVDVLANQKRSFAGITFRKKDGTSEEVYLRMHKSLQPDAVQYTPIYNFESTWQLYHNYQANIDMHKTGWNTIRVEVQDTRAHVYVNDILVITVDELKTDNKFGSIGLFSLFENTFSNFKYSSRSLEFPPLKLNSKVESPGIIKEWNVTPAMLFENTSLDIEKLSKLSTIRATTEKSGLLPISKYIQRSSTGNFEGNPEFFTIATTTINSIADENRKFSFDYSDKIIVYLNGRRLFQGNNAFRAKGVQFKGNLNIDTNVLYLPLTKGENKIQCVVIDRANGWGIMGKIE